MKSVKDIITQDVSYTERAMHAAISKAEKWLDENWNSLWSTGQHAKAREALRRYEKLCDERSRVVNNTSCRHKLAVDNNTKRCKNMVMVKTWSEKQQEKRARKTNTVMGVMALAVLVLTFVADYLITL